MSQTSTLVTHTGSWKYIRPVYHDRVAPCNQGCPVGIDIEGYMNLLREDRDRGGTRPAARGEPDARGDRACVPPSVRERLQPPVPRRGGLDPRRRTDARRPRARRAGDRHAPSPRRAERVAVVGSGPAGLACAYHLARFGYQVTVFEAAAAAGRHAAPRHSRVSPAARRARSRHRTHRRTGRRDSLRHARGQRSELDGAARNVQRGVRRDRRAHEPRARRARRGACPA